MKSQVLIRRGMTLLQREKNLRYRFLVPVYGVTSWTPPALDATSAYVGLLHAEAESALEFIVRSSLDHSVEVTRRYATHHVLTNALICYKRYVNSLIPELNLIPRARDLRNDPSAAIQAWENHAADYYTAMINRNHGAGSKYVEKLLHPLGVVVDRERFIKLTALGVKELADVASIGSTDLRELVELRGVAMHANLSTVETRLSATNPLEIAKRGEAAANFTMNLARKIAHSVW
jgi:hypothetical protein